MIFRYPGGKTKLKPQILAAIKQRLKPEHEYREPFFGGGSIGLEFLQNGGCSKIWINDYDSGIFSIWAAVRYMPEVLKKMIKEFTPSVESFDAFKASLSKPTKGFEMNKAFMKLAIHQMSYSGLGTMSGGPLGGRDQKSKYKIDCRWNPETLCKKIDKLHSQMKAWDEDLHISNLDFISMIEEDDIPATIYLDPPYFVKGESLYQCGMSPLEHSRLRDALKVCPHEWVLSYDDCWEVRIMYEEWADIQEIEVNYSITAVKDEAGKKKGSKKKELLICPK